MDLIDWLVAPRRPIGATVVVLSLLLAPVAIAKHQTWATAGGVGLFVLAVVAAVVALVRQKLLGALAAAGAIVLFAAGVFLGFTLQQ